MSRTPATTTGMAPDARTAARKFVALSRMKVPLKSLRRQNEGGLGPF